MSDTPTDSSARPPVDLGVLADLLRQIGDESDAARTDLIETYLNDTGQRVTDLAAAVAVEDSGAVAKAAHGMRSSSALVGAVRLAALLEGTETVARAGGGDLHAMEAEIGAEYGRVVTALRQAEAAA